ncbi:hypothetical protein I7I53_08866 [Histoplasma capsulatum var. duboisii H88]|uniref:Secreted protein n=1 Tax=Ajellomyces capsulatus (strain H88) TaxID=544711 RepID=A0A8A1L9N0_AJEC8|nr:hypothetical protein I7I53_08866 [Histoplasma capsulatum var. duboisii H88]
MVNCFHSLSMLCAVAVVWMCVCFSVCPVSFSRIGGGDSEVPAKVCRSLGLATFRANLSNQSQGGELALGGVDSVSSVCACG